MREISLGRIPRGVIPRSQGVCVSLTGYLYTASPGAARILLLSIAAASWQVARQPLSCCWLRRLRGHLLGGCLHFLASSKLEHLFFWVFCYCCCCFLLCGFPLLGIPYSCALPIFSCFAFFTPYSFLCCMDADPFAIVHCNYFLPCLWLILSSGLWWGFYNVTIFKCIIVSLDGLCLWWAY